MEGGRNEQNKKRREEEARERGKRLKRWQCIKLFAVNYLFVGINVCFEEESTRHMPGPFISEM